jgi:hypothetical protein
MMQCAACPVLQQATTHQHVTPPCQANALPSRQATSGPNGKYVHQRDHTASHNHNSSIAPASSQPVAHILIHTTSKGLASTLSQLGAQSEACPLSKTSAACSGELGEAGSEGLVRGETLVLATRSGEDESCETMETSPSPEVPEVLASARKTCRPDSATFAGAWCTIPDQAGLKFSTILHKQWLWLDELHTAPMHGSCANSGTCGATVCPCARALISAHSGRSRCIQVINCWLQSACTRLGGRGPDGCHSVCTCASQSSACLGTHMHASCLVTPHQPRTALHC